MSKAAKGILIAAFCALALWATLSTLYTHSVSEELTTLRREERSDIVYLRNRVRDLESILATRPVDGEASETTEAVTPTPDTEVTTEPTSEPETEAVTIPTHNSPETIPAVDAEPEAPPAFPYLVAAHEGIIGLFDASGALLRTVNVYIMTLPEADRAALSVGIPTGDWAEALHLLEMYE